MPFYQRHHNSNLQSEEMIYYVSYWRTWYENAAMDVSDGDASGAGLTSHL
ncbi:MAG: hypothetical protein ACXVRJ_09060 [Gaiellaceae bacterium]